MTLLTPPFSSSDALDAPASTGDSAGMAPLTVYQKTRSGMPPFRAYLADTWSRRPFIWHLARTQLKAENYDSLIGQVWILLNPLFMAAVYLMVRSIFRPIGNDPAEQADVLAHIVMGVFFFRFASAALGGGASSITSNSQMVLNTAFPRVIFPISAAVQAFMEFMPALAVYLALHWYLGQPFTLWMLYLPVVVVLLVVLNLGISLFFAPLNVLYQDVKSGVPYIAKMWFFATPVMYSVALVEENMPSVLPLLRLNPLFPFFAVLEDITDGVAPSMTDLAMAAAWSALFLVAGSVLFLRKERQFARRL